jgi:hypothetical protein
LLTLTKEHNMARGRPHKGEFADLDTEWKDSIAAMPVEEINSKIAEVAKAEAENQKVMKEDQQLAEAKMAAKMAGEGYREATKMSKLRIKYCVRVLADRGHQ